MKSSRTSTASCRQWTAPRSASPASAPPSPRAPRGGLAPARQRWPRLPDELRADPLRRPDADTLLTQLCTHFAGTEDGERLIFDEMLLFLAAGSQTSVAS